MRTIHRDIVGGFIFSKDGKLLLGKNRKGGVYESNFVVPGGGVDENESKEEALQREMMEETGIDIQNAKVTPFHESIGEHEKNLRSTGELVLVKMNFYDYRIDLDLNADEIVVKADDDWNDPIWFEIEKLNNLNLSEPTRNALVANKIVDSN